MDDQDILDIMQLVYNRWSEAAHLLTHCKKEKNDGSPDWNKMHEYRLESAKAEESKWLGLKDRYLNENRELINRSYGI